MTVDQSDTTKQTAQTLATSGSVTAARADGSSQPVAAKDVATGARSADSEMKDTGSKDARSKDMGAKPRARDDIFGSFLIAESEYAIPVSVIKEVVSEPHLISPVPLTPHFMLGLFNLRGQIIPIVDLRILLEMPEPADQTPRKVAIIEHGEHCIGLLFDRTGEVLSGSHAARVDFKPSGEGVKDLVINGVLKFDNGNRLVQLLDPYELLNLNRIPRSDTKADRAAAQSAKGKRRNCISFKVGHAFCAIDLRHVKEIRVMPELDRSILAHGHVIGTTNLRGVILPVIDFRTFMGDASRTAEEEANDKDRKMLVLETAEGPIGLIVCSIDSILPYYREDVLPFAKLSQPRRDFVRGCLINDEHQIVMLLDQEKLRSEPELVSTAKVCQEVYPASNEESKSAVEKASAERRTFIRFTFEKMFALDTACVSEVINCPEHLLEPPHKEDFVEGIINLRGELITLLNPRLLYGFEKGDVVGQKVLIFKHEESKYGILVDSVDEIIMTTSDAVADVHSVDRQGNKMVVFEDIVGCLSHKLSDNTKVSILILDAASLIDRCMASLDLLPAE